MLQTPSEDEPSTSAELPLMTDEKICLVCADKSDGTHFGIESCRACAAFFRRSVVSGKKYVCRYGPERCVIDKSVRCMCRKCRFQKCFAMGMKREMVQGKRDPIIPKIKDPDPLSAVPSTSKSVATSPMSPEDNKLLAYRPFIKEEILEEPKFLQKIFANYRQLCAKRRATELGMDTTFTARMNTYGPLTGYALGTNSKLSAYYKAHMPAIWDFVSMTFDEFNNLTADEKWELFQSFMVLLWGMDNSYHTFKKIDKEHYHRIIMISETTYFDINRGDEWFCDLQTTRDPASVKIELQKLLNQCMSKPRQKVLHSMNDMQIMDEEYAALIGLMLWNQNFEKSNDDVDKLAKHMRDRIFEELHLFYRSKQIPMYAQRLGELMGLHGTVLLEVLRFREDMELFSLLEAFQKDDFFYEMVRNSRCF